MPKLFERKGTLRIIKMVSLFLLISLIANFTSKDWDWGIFDFVVAAGMIFATGIAIDFVARKIRSFTTKAIAISGITLIFLATWAQLAVDAVTKALTVIF